MSQSASLRLGNETTDSFARLNSGSGTGDMTAYAPFINSLKSFHLSTGLSTSTSTSTCTTQPTWMAQPRPAGGQESPPAMATQAGGEATTQRWSSFGLDWPAFRTDTESSADLLNSTRRSTTKFTPQESTPNNAGATAALSAGDPHGQTSQLHPIMHEKVRELLHDRPHFQLPGFSIARLQAWYREGGMARVWAGVSMKVGTSDCSNSARTSRRSNKDKTSITKNGGSGKGRLARSLAARKADAGDSSSSAWNSSGSAGGVSAAAQLTPSTVLGSAGQVLGNFLITHYTFALESDPVHATSPKVAAPGLDAGARYRESFLWSNKGIKMQGTGLAEDGRYIMWSGGRFKYGIGGRFRSPKPWGSIAIDPSVISPSSRVEIDAYPDKGPFSADDTGGAIKGQHIDVFVGAVPIKEAYALGKKHSIVRLLSGPRSAASEKLRGQQPAAQPGRTLAAPSLFQVRAGAACLQRHTHGSSLRQIQQLLRITVDGAFGEQTENAVRSFQASHYLTVDGVVGKQTLAALESKTPVSAGPMLGQAAAAGHATADDAGGIKTAADGKQSPKGTEQMAKLLSVARNSNPPRGHCDKAVKHYIKEAGGYGNIQDVYSDKRMQPQGEAHDFHDCVQRRGPGAFGLEQVAAATPFDAPAGALVVVKHGSPGTSHPTAGDITVRGTGIEFYNDGVMHYHGPKAWPPKKGGLLGVYKPK